MSLSLSHRSKVTAEQKENARRLRRDQTPAEAMLWEALRGKQLNGLKFRRQQPVRGFVVDFYCEALNLAVELDGAVHDDPAVAAKDREREQVLQAAGLRLIRLKNSMIETDLNAALAAITALPKTPSPSPTRRGGGAPD